MLDAYIIDQIRREKESNDSFQVPLRIEIPDPNADDEPGPAPIVIRDDEDDSGIIIIDNRVY